MVEIKNKFSDFVDHLQRKITSEIELLDKNSKFKNDKWYRKEGGGGLTMVIENGNVFEKGGVNVSKVHGILPKSMSEILGVDQSDFFACGISMVLHPKNPMAPTFHSNLRYFELYKKNKIIDCWFGGGLDLTPYYLFEKDVSFFHNCCKKVCDKFNSNYYIKFKEKCDKYFWNTHRNEARGVGGLFFDYCRGKSKAEMNNWLMFVQELGNNFMNPYLDIVRKRTEMRYSKQNVDWQQIRRGRYVEFNLLHDKGTLFGLKTKGRIESILISMPPSVKWSYDFIPEKGSDEENLIKILKSPKNWI